MPEITDFNLDQRNGGWTAEYSDGTVKTGNLTSVAGDGILYSTPSTRYHVALRANQPGNISPVDQSGKNNDPTINTAMFPGVWVAGTAYTVGQYASPSIANGLLYKCTAATGAAGTTQPTWPTTVGGTVVDGGVTWTCERGPWGNSAAGVRHFNTLQSSTLGQLGHLTIPAFTWDMAAGDSIILRVRQAWNLSTDSRTAVTGNLMGNRHAATSRRGLQVIGTAAYKELQFVISDGTTTIVSGHIGDGVSGRPLFSRPPCDGSVRDTVFAVDGQLKRSYCWTDGVAWAQSEMFSTTDYTPHGRDLSTVTGSTATTNQFLIGCVPGATSTVDYGLIALDIVVLPAQGLPVRMQDIVSLYASRGADALMPSLLVGA